MPYIRETNRDILNDHIENLATKIMELSQKSEYGESSYSLNNGEVCGLLGDINYSISRLCSKIMGDPTYSKIAMITGVLENVKQEYYRRVAIPFEENKMAQNGDIREYKKAF